MGIRLSLLVLLLAGAAQAGPMELELKETAPPAITSNDHWYFNIAMPGWLPWISGDIGLNGVSNSVQVPFDKIITHVAGIASVSAEVRRDRFGIYGDLLYTSLSAGIYGNRLVKKANLTVDQYIADGEVYYRVLDRPRGWLDLRAGARYNNTFSRLELTAADGKIKQAAAELVSALNADLRDILERLLEHRLDTNNSTIPFPPLGAEEKIKILKFIIEARRNPMTAQQKIASFLHRQLNRGFSLTEYWTDPYVGLGGRYNLGKAYYLTGKVDVGGFEVGSDVTVQAYGGLGYQLTRNIYTELGFRYLFSDYNNDGYLYKVSTYGPQVTTGIQF